MEQRSVLFDTETTGLNPAAGDRVIEIAALELVRDLPTGRIFHTLIDPERDVPEDATRIHGFTSAHLAGKPRFAQVAADVLAFFADSRLVAHNAPFDFGFLNAEFARLGQPPLDAGRMVDTLAIAKARFPGMPNNLNALCTRFGVDISARTTHNALLDCRLLADVYLELIGGRQRGFAFRDSALAGTRLHYAAPVARTPVRIVPTEAQRAAHAQLVAQLKDPLWPKAASGEAPALVSGEAPASVSGEAPASVSD